MTTNTTTTNRSTMTTTTNPPTDEVGLADTYVGLARRLELVLGSMPYGGAAGFHYRRAVELRAELDHGAAFATIAVDHLASIVANLTRLADVLRLHAEQAAELELELGRHRTALRGLAALRELVAEVAP